MTDPNQVSLYMEATHHLVHTKEQDWDNTVTFALTERDILMLALSLTGIQFLYPCLSSVSGDIQKRLLEVTRVQHPEWTVDGEEGS